MCEEHYWKSCKGNNHKNDIYFFCISHCDRQNICTLKYITWFRLLQLLINWSDVIPFFPSDNSFMINWKWVGIITFLLRSPMQVHGWSKATAHLEWSHEALKYRFFSRKNMYLMFLTCNIKKCLWKYNPPKI